MRLWSSRMTLQVLFETLRMTDGSIGTVVTVVMVKGTHENRGQQEVVPAGDDGTLGWL